MKTYNAHIQFEAVQLSVKANNKKEAKEKIIAKLKKHTPKLDKQNFYLDKIS